MTAAHPVTEPVAPYRPSWLLRRANTMLTRVLGKGRGPRFMRLLTMSPFGQVAWVRDARATKRVELRRGDEHITYAVRELDAAEAVPVLRRYLSMPARFFVRSHVHVTARSPDRAIAAEAHRHPVFELAPIR